jgi:hypothetical protein
MLAIPVYFVILKTQNPLGGLNMTSLFRRLFKRNSATPHREGNGRDKNPQPNSKRIAYRGPNTVDISLEKTKIRILYRQIVKNIVTYNDFNTSIRVRTLLLPKIISDKAKFTAGWNSLTTMCSESEIYDLVLQMPYLEIVLSPRF